MNYNKILLIVAMLLASFIKISAQDYISGTVTDVKDIPLEGVTCTLISAKDSVKIAGAITKKDGSFRIPINEKKKYLLDFSFIGFKEVQRTVMGGNIGIIKMKEDEHQLQQITVTSKTLHTFGNTDVILLNKNSKNIGNNALDAIGSLPQFRLSATDNELRSVDGKTILVLVNGIRSSSRDLMLLKSKDIKNIHYYSNPPARFAHENIGAVIDVETKKTNNKLYSLYLDTKNGVTTGYGTDVLSLSYRDSLNMVTATYFVDYRSLNKNIMDNSYLYDNQLNNDYKGLSGSYKGQYHIGQFVYQRYQGKNLFNAKLEYRKSPGTQMYSQSLNLANRDETTNNRKLTSDMSSISTDLYYGHTFVRGNNLSVNVLNTFYTSKSDNMLESTSSSYSFKNNINNKSYSLIAELLYADKLWKGNLQLGAYYQFKNLKQTNSDVDVSRINTQKQYVYMDYNNQVGLFSYDIGLGLENNRYKLVTNEVANYTVFRPMATFNFQLSKCGSMRLSSFIKSSVPDIGSLTDSKVAVDEHFYRQGNSTLTPYHYSQTELSFQYASNNGVWYIKPSISYSYYPYMNMSILTKDGEDIVCRTMKVDDANVYGASLSLSCHPLSWLTLQPYYNYQFSKYVTPNQRTNHSLNNFGISGQFVKGKWELIVNNNFPMTNVDGDIYEKMGYNITGSLQYKYKAMSFGLEYIHNPNPSRMYANTNYFSYSEETKWENFKNLVALKFVYYFTKGKSRHQASKQISNSDNDSGLTKYNTAK